MQLWGVPRMVLRLAVLGVLAGALTILGCSGGGGGGGESTGTTTPGTTTPGTTTPAPATTPATADVAANDVVAPVNAATGPTIIRSLEGQTFAFPGGIGNDDLTPVLANQPIMVTFTNTASATPTTTVTAPNIVGTDGQPASFTADTTFGSCIFRVRNSTFPQPGPQVGQTLTVSPCNINIHTGGAVANGQATTVQILLQLGGIPSAANQATVSINPTTGVVTVNNVTLPSGVGSVTLVVPTGGLGTTP